MGTNQRSHWHRSFNYASRSTTHRLWQLWLRMRATDLTVSSPNIRLCWISQRSRLWSWSLREQPPTYLDWRLDQTPNYHESNNYRHSYLSHGKKISNILSLEYAWLRNGLLHVIAGDCKTSLFSPIHKPQNWSKVHRLQFADEIVGREMKGHIFLLDSRQSSCL